VFRALRQVVRALRQVFRALRQVFRALRQVVRALRQVVRALRQLVLVPSVLRQLVHRHHLVVEVEVVEVEVLRRRRVVGQIVRNLKTKL
jgi:hypothetical protein